MGWPYFYATCHTLNRQAYKTGVASGINWLVTIADIDSLTVCRQ